MRLKITLESPRLELPTHHNHLIQGFIYGQLEPNLATWLHEDAYHFAKRNYKMFTFSRLQGSYQHHPKTKTISFTGPVSFLLASHNNQVLASFAEHLLKSQNLYLGKNPLEISSVEILKQAQANPNKATRIKTLSPITSYSTLSKPDGKKLVHYYAPHHQEWSLMLLNNLARKAKALDWQGSEDALKDAVIKVLKTNPKDKKVVKYKNTFIEAYMGVFEVELPQAYFDLAYDTGLGSKNAQGFGMVEVV